MKSYKELDVYKRSYFLAIEIHRLASRLPKEYRFDLSDQIRRASRSIPANIAEGFGRSKSSKDTINQLKTALGSNYEMIFNLEFMKDIEIIDHNQFDKLFKEYTISGKQLVRLIESLNHRP